MRFFRKMAPITTSGSGFHFIFEFLVLELIENEFLKSQNIWHMGKIDCLRCPVRWCTVLPENEEFT